MAGGVLCAFALWVLRVAVAFLIFVLCLLRVAVPSVLFVAFQLFLLRVAAAACGACLGARVGTFSLPF